ncbi:Cenp-O kinetochore centromere component-domain-containing protein [Amylocarpus encephaloides]|uniref:Cenp-O kinetochore centromere component-domain-containing protein n=1 Tax=Amylocarpus encephaloides TaxID=45428 RepID=A0A9P7Y6N9_9HELO|nr:Cenp-O kinetochore centromere component-domain-containing protein [Amylocarpus encephaloides]
MRPSPVTSTSKFDVDNPIAAQLDDEIASLQSQIASLKTRRKLQAATIISSHSSKSTLSRLRNSTQPPSNPATSVASQTLSPEESNPLFATSKLQTLHNQQNLYRFCGTITAFHIRDPDPNAVDSGNVLGLRIDVAASGKFITPYYIFLNKPFPDPQLLRVHRHTVPSYIPLAQLASRHLPHGKGAVAMNALKGEKRQDLTRFVRALRREIVAYHNRISVINCLRKSLQLDENSSTSRKGKGRERVIVDVSAADAEAKQLRIEWHDGRIGRCAVDGRGEVRKCVIIGEDGLRDRDNERAVEGGRIEGIADRLKEGIY